MVSTPGYEMEDRLRMRIVLVAVFTPSKSISFFYIEISANMESLGKMPQRAMSIASNLSTQEQPP